MIDKLLRILEVLEMSEISESLREKSRVKEKNTEGEVELERE